MWKKFPRNVPEKEGWYQCTVEVKNQQRYVMNLYWRFDDYAVYRGRWRDNIRQDVFSTYYVYDYSGKRLFTAKECDRTYSVVAWKGLPKPYMRGFEYISILHEESTKRRK